MSVEKLLEACSHIICIYGNKSNLQEFELLAYEQACRTIERVLKDIRLLAESENGGEDYPR